MNYAKINANGIVVGVSSLAGSVDMPNMLQIAEYDASLMGKKWDGQKFIENPNPPVALVAPMTALTAKIDKLVLDVDTIKKGVAEIKNKP